MKSFLLSIFLISGLYVVTPTDADAMHHIKRRGNVQCCTPEIIARGEQCRSDCKVEKKTRKRGYRPGVKNRMNVPCCDTPGLRDDAQCNMSCNYAPPAGVRRCNDAMRRAGRCQ